MVCTPPFWTHIIGASSELWECSGFGKRLLWIWFVALTTKHSSIIVSGIRVAFWTLIGITHDSHGKWLGNRFTSLPHSGQVNVSRWTLSTFPAQTLHFRRFSSVCAVTFSGISSPLALEHVKSVWYTSFFHCLFFPMYFMGFPHRVNVGRVLLLFPRNTYTFSHTVGLLSRQHKRYTRLNHATRFLQVLPLDSSHQYSDSSLWCGIRHHHLSQSRVGWST